VDLFLSVAEWASGVGLCHVFAFRVVFEFSFSRFEVHFCALFLCVIVGTPQRSDPLGVVLWELRNQRSCGSALRAGMRPDPSSIGWPLTVLVAAFWPQNGGR
jgi:hypothetical protein